MYRQKLYRHKDTEQLYVTTFDCQVRDDWGKWVDGIAYEQVNECNFSDIYVMTRERFDFQFERVEYRCEVDLYAILHEVLGKQAAVEYASRIDAELCKKQYGTRWE